MSAVLQSLVNQPYKHGFVTEIESDIAPKGLNEDIIRLISTKKNEPEWLLSFRLKAYQKWLTMTEPEWQNVHYPKIDFQAISYYSAPKPKKKLAKPERSPKVFAKSWGVGTGSFMGWFFRMLGQAWAQQSLGKNRTSDFDLLAALFDPDRLPTVNRQPTAPLSGIFNIDKPAGMTSHDVVAAIRRAGKERRVGHAGTLDPMATGVLLVAGPAIGVDLGMSWLPRRLPPRSLLA